MAAYIVVQGEVHNLEGYKKYMERSPGVLAKYNGKFLARGGAVVTLEGPAAPSRVVILEFPDLETAQAFYHSPEYTEIREIRKPHATLSFIAVDGVKPA